MAKGIAKYLKYDPNEKLFKDAQFWFGATAPTASRYKDHWMFVTGEKMIYESWHPDQPSGDGKCATYSPKRNSKSWKDIDWNDANCDHKFRFVCEVSPKSKPAGELQIPQDFFRL